MNEDISHYFDEPLERIRKEIANRTPEQKSAIELQIKEDEERAKRNRIDNVRDGWNAPKRQLRAEDLDRSGQWGVEESKLAKMLGTGFLVGLVGGRGPGKTQLAVELMKTTTCELRTAYYNTLTGLFLQIKATFKKDSSESEEDLMDRLCKPSLLVIDEIGMRSDGDWENRMLFELIDRRYRRMADTLLIANLAREQFLQTIGESLASRMQETGGIVECTWESYRL